MKDNNHANSSTIAQVQSAKNAHYHTHLPASRITDPTPITLSVLVVLELSAMLKFIRPSSSSSSSIFARDVVLEDCPRS